MTRNKSEGGGSLELNQIMRIHHTFIFFWSFQLMPPLLQYFKEMVLLPLWVLLELHFPTQTTGIPSRVYHQTILGGVDRYTQFTHTTLGLGQLLIDQYFIFITHIFHSAIVRLYYVACDGCLLSRLNFPCLAQVWNYFQNHPCKLLGLFPGKVLQKLVFQHVDNMA